MNSSRRRHRSLHDSCKECLSACWTLAIKEGNVEAVSCPSITCTKRRVDRQNRTQDPHATAESGKAEEGVDAARSGLGKGAAGEVAVGLVQEVVGVELRERLEWLKRKKRVENGRYRHGHLAPGVDGLSFVLLSGSRPNLHDLSASALPVTCATTTSPENIDDNGGDPSEERIPDRHGNRLDG